MCNISVVYDGNFVLNNVSFDIKKNEIIVFVGESGSGKIILINVLFGLL